MLLTRWQHERTYYGRTTRPPGFTKTEQASQGATEALCDVRKYLGGSLTMER